MPDNPSTAPNNPSTAPDNPSTDTTGSEGYYSSSYTDISNINPGNYPSGDSRLEASEADILSGALDDQISQILTSKTINGIFAMPYQFLPTVDRRIESPVNTESVFSLEDKMGRRYGEKIASHLPLLFLTPCRPRFMEGFNQNDISTVLNSLLTGQDLIPELSKSGRYFTTEFAYNEYYQCVNLMCAEVAYFCGIQDEYIQLPNSNGEIQIKNIDWYTQARNDSFNNYFFAKDSVVFYADGLTTISDSFSNTTTDSQIASTVNGFSETAKELKFLLGENSLAAKLTDFVEQAENTIKEGLSGFVDFAAGGLVNDLLGTGVNTVMQGGKMLFPKIWGDSSFSRSYSFDIKLRSPDHDNVSIFLNLLVPYIHLLALCLPQSITSGTAKGSPNAYNSPFLLRAYSKGQFNINMGIITDMSVTRGGEAQWNDNGLPTQMDISLTIEDLYNTLFMTNPNPEGKSPIPGFTSITDFLRLDVVSNTEMLDFLSNLAGLNIAGVELARKTEIVKYLTLNQLERAPANIYHYFGTGFSNLVRKMFES